MSYDVLKCSLIVSLTQVASRIWALFSHYYPFFPFPALYQILHLSTPLCLLSLFLTNQLFNSLPLSLPPYTSPLFPKLFLFSLHFPLFILFSILLSPFFPFLPPIILSFLLFHNIPLSHHIFRVKTLVFMWDIIFHTGMECNKCVYF